MKIDFERWAVFAPKNASGFGRMADDVRAVLGVRTHLVAEHANMQSLPPVGNTEVAVPKALDVDGLVFILQSIEGLQGVLFFETYSWNPNLFEACRRLNVKTVCVPMWEWFNGKDAAWRACDLFVCPSSFTESVVRSYGFTNAVSLPWTLDLTKFPLRNVQGVGRQFVHNAGVVDVQDRKGTWDTIHAFKNAKRDDIRLLVRMQREAELPKLDDRIELRVGNLLDPAELYADHDVAIQPSKMEGIGFMVLEPVASGIPTITLDYPPMSEYVRDARMRVRKKWFKRRAFPSSWVRHAHLRLPNIRDLTRVIEWCADNDLSNISTANRRWAVGAFDPASLRAQWQRTLGDFF